MSKKPYDSLGIPPAARNEGGAEVLRAAVVGQGLAMSMRRGFDDPAAWGALLATAARQVAQIYGRETGVGEAVGTKLNVPLMPGAGDREFFAAWERVLDHLRRHRPEFILFQCGADSLRGDPLARVEACGRDLRRGGGDARSA